MKEQKKFLSLPSYEIPDSLSSSGYYWASLETHLISCSLSCTSCCLFFLMFVIAWNKQWAKSVKQFLKLQRQTTQISLPFFLWGFMLILTVEGSKIPDLINCYILHLYFKHFKMSNSNLLLKLLFRNIGFTSIQKEFVTFWFQTL